MTVAASIVDSEMKPSHALWSSEEKVTFEEIVVMEEKNMHSPT